MDVFSRFLFLTRTCQGSIVRSSPYFGGERESRLGIKPTATSNVSFLTGWISTCRLKPHMIMVKIRDVIFFFFFLTLLTPIKAVPQISNDWLTQDFLTVFCFAWICFIAKYHDFHMRTSCEDFWKTEVCANSSLAASLALSQLLHDNTSKIIIILANV